MSDVATRNRVCGAILRWVDAMGDHPRRDLETFLASDKAAAADGIDTEVAKHAVAYMEARGLLTVLRAWTENPVRLTLTVEGRDCIYRGADVEAYVRDREPGTRMEFNVNGGQGHQFGNVGDSITQTNVVQQGMAVEQFAQLVVLLRQYADDPRVNEQQAEELRDVAHDLEDEIQDGEVEPSTARRRLAAVRRAAARLAPALSLELTAAADQAAQLLG
ncbi:hypothetical protein [Streptomyces sp. CA-251247]|uniref:hypothetical protein n=1 Tax=Streptomyces sp. CA-251247 TaxID=3240062 RepID=UPI003D8E1F11